MIDPKELLTPEIIESELNTPEKRYKIALELQSLQTHQGWIFIERVLRYHIDKQAEQILNDSDLAPEAEKEIKRERAFLLLFKSLPTGWVGELMQNESQTREEQDDPYS